jgi:CDP-glucose 4,6-dehydratase
MDILGVDGIKGIKGPILVTGHSGFKGTWLTLLLERLGIETIGYSLPPTNDSIFSRIRRGGAITECFADIRDVSTLSKFIHSQKPTAIIHMAAQPLVLESFGNPRYTFETNVMGTANLLESAFGCSSVKTVVVVTTDKVYRNDNDPKHSFKESDALEGKDPYSASKVGAEAVVAAWQTISRVAGGPNVLSVRAGNVIGGGDFAVDRLLPDIIRSFISGNDLVLRNPKSTRPWQHVLDPLVGYLAALLYADSGGQLKAFNFGPVGNNLSVLEVTDLALSHWGQEFKGELKIESSQKPFESEYLQLNSDLGQELLSWFPTLSQSQSVISTVNWWSKTLNFGIGELQACQDDLDILLKSLEVKP